mmetsp:Transcript_80061/g.232447  ORF Transcript_80061/g.232447 Transcript_80061/m.232447 type:complete len:224 (+) Transcript_80061:198-869(+)
MVDRNDGIEVNLPHPRFEFPFKLHKILDDAASQGNDSIISWHPDGTCFKVHDKAELERLILPRYMSSPKYRSFQRQLSFYRFHFERDSTTDRFRCYSHPLFVRGRPDLCRGMERHTITKQKPNEDIEPIAFRQTYHDGAGDSGQQVIAHSEYVGQLPLYAYNAGMDATTSPHHRRSMQLRSLGGEEVETLLHLSQEANKLMGVFNPGGTGKQEHFSTQGPAPP